MKQKSQMKQETSQRYALSLRLPLMIVMLMLMVVQAFAQSIVVKGVVKDPQGEPIVGASVMPKGAAGQGTITDIDGKFTLSVKAKATVVVSYVGFQAQEFVARANAVEQIVLQEDSKTLDNVVVVAYGTQKKVSVTAAISSANMNDLRQSAAPNLDNALAGRINGLISSQTGGGQPGVDGSRLYLRGVSTVNGSSPLILVDGVTYTNVRGNIISEIDPNEVESVSVLKDASATAVFGVRGANGVILITTRRGKSGKTNLSASVQQSFTSFTRTDTRLHSWDFMRIRNEAFHNDGKKLPYTDDQIENFKDPLKGLDPADPDYEKKAEARYHLFCDHYYMKEMFRKYTPQTKINMNVSGGSDRFRYFLNAGYIHQGGNLKTEPKSKLGYDPSAHMNRWNFRSNFDYDVTKTLKAHINLGTVIQTTNMPSSRLYGYDSGWMMRDVFYQAQIMWPIQPGPVTLPGYGVPEGMMIRPKHMDRAPFEIINRKGVRNVTQVDLSTQMALEWDLSKLVTKGLNIKGQISYNSSGSTGRESNKTEADYYITPNYEKGTFVYSLHQTTPEKLSTNRFYSSLYSINAQASVNYHRTFDKKHDVTGMLLVQRDFWEKNEADLPYNVLGLSSRFTYAYDSRYLAEVNMGYNGSEQFAPSKRFGFFPAFSLGWVVTNESFMKDVKWLDNLKLRYSNGKVGNDKIGNKRFLYLDDIQTSGTSYAGGLGASSIRSIYQGLLGNKEITWETAQKQNFGIDFGVLRCLNFSVEYFKENRSDILIKRNTIPAFQGVNTDFLPKVNMGKMKNSGIEFEGTFDKNITKDWHIQLRGNYSTNDNEITFYDEAIRTEDYAYRYQVTGYRLNQCWGYEIDYAKNGGYFISKEDIKESGLTYSFGTPRPGDFRYVDKNGDNVIDDKDMSPIKYSKIPGISYGFGLNTSYKGFDFSIFFQGLGHYSMSYQSHGVFETISHGYYFKYHRNAWTPERWANHEEITYPALSTDGSVSQKPNSFFIQDRSFLRLKNIELGYTLPKGLLKFAGVTNCRFYVSGLNLYVWDHLHTDHLDPEVNDPIGYPMTKTVTVGLNVNF